jgi:uracil-DNA glycosylase
MSVSSLNDDLPLTVHKTLEEARAALGGIPRPDPNSKPRTDVPRSNKEQAELARKRALRGALHMAPLAAYVDGLRVKYTDDRVPDFDPTEAGVRARILILAEAPGPRATVERGGSGFVSPDNDDGSAEAMWRLFAELGLDRATEVVTWNVVPSYLGDDTAIRAAKTSDIVAARPSIEELVELLPNLRVVLLLGKSAQRGWAHLGLALPTVAAPHPSPQNLNTRPEARDQLRDAIQRSRQIAGTAPR